MSNPLSLRKNDPGLRSIQTARTPRLRWLQGGVSEVAFRLTRRGLQIYPAWPSDLPRLAFRFQNVLGMFASAFGIVFVVVGCHVQVVVST